jgi:hypothetical protein
MKKMITTAIVLALTGVASVAQSNQEAPKFTNEQMQKMPEAFRDLLGRLKGNAKELAAIETPTSGLTQYIQGMQAQIKQDLNTLTAINKQKGYDPYVTQFVHFADNLLNQAQAQLNQIQANANQVSNTFQTVTDTITTLQSYTPPVPTSPPGSCIQYRSNPVTCLRIEPGTNPGTWRCYSPIEQVVKEKKTLVDRYYNINPDTAGQTSTGQPAILSRNTNVKVYLKATPDLYNNPNNEVYCITQ